MTQREKVAKLAIWAANRLAPDASTKEAYQHACAVWRDNEQEFHWQERNDLKSFFFFLFGEIHYEQQKTAAPPIPQKETTPEDRMLCCVCKRSVTGIAYCCDDCGSACCDQCVSMGLDGDTRCDNCLPDNAATLREELLFDYAALVDASGVTSVAEAQRLGSGEHAPDCGCPTCSGDFSPEEQELLKEPAKQPTDYGECPSCGVLCDASGRLCNCDEPQCPPPPSFGKCDLCKRETDDLKQCSKCGAWCCYLDWWPEDASERVGAPGYPGAVLCDHCDWKKTYGEDL